MKKLKLNLSIVHILLVLLFVVSLGVIPLFNQFIITSKVFLTFLFTLGVILIYLASSWKNKGFFLLKTPFVPALVLFGGIALISSLVSETYPVTNLLDLGGIMISFVILTLLGSTLIKEQKNTTSLAVKSLILISIALIITALLQKFGVGPSILINKLLGNVAPNDLSFSLVGSTFVALQLAILSLVGLLSKIYVDKKVRLWEILALIIIISSSIFYGWTVLPGKITSLVILDPAASWNIILSAFGNLKIVLFGVGPVNYSNAFNQFKPAWLNTTQFANVQFTQATSFFMTIAVTLGAIGLFAWLWLVISLIRQTKKIKASTKPIHNILLTSFLISFFLPINMIMLVVQATLLVCWVAEEKSRFENYKFGFFKTRFSKLSAATRKIIILALTILTFFVFTLVARAAYADLLMFQSSRALLNKDFIKTYSLQQKAVSANPYSDQNRKQYGSTNITIATALSQKTELTQEEKEQFSKLIQQAIREGKAGVLLDGMDPNNWAFLGQIYQSLFGVAQNADEWAMQSYIEAVKLAPTNPELRIKLGGISYARGKYEDALNLFIQATELKPNLANAYYNIANTLVKMNRLEEAKLAYQKTLLLVRSDSDDYLKASAEMQALEKKPAEPAKTTSGEDTSSIKSFSPQEVQVEAPPESAQ